MPVHIPVLFHAVEVQTLHVYSGSLKDPSEPVHSIQTIALVHPVQLGLQAKFL
jgi:hypothetical protein